MTRNGMMDVNTASRLYRLSDTYRSSTAASLGICLASQLTPEKRLSPQFLLPTRLSLRFIKSFFRIVYFTCVYLALHRVHFFFFYMSPTVVLTNFVFWFEFRTIVFLG
ncbi:MAG: hypothetical protein ABJF90_00370, partial [Lentilitoribacter sp.]